MIGLTLSDQATPSSGGIKTDLVAVDRSGLNMNATRLSPGATSESSSSHFTCQRGFEGGEPGEPFPPKPSRATMPLATGSPTPAKTIGIVPVATEVAAAAAVVPIVTIMSGLQADQLLRGRPHPID